MDCSEHTDAGAVVSDDCGLSTSGRSSVGRARRVRTGTPAWIHEPLGLGPRAMRGAAAGFSGRLRSSTWNIGALVLRPTRAPGGWGTPADHRVSRPGDAEGHPRRSELCGGARLAVVRVPAGAQSGPSRSGDHSGTWLPCIEGTGSDLGPALTRGAGVGDPQASDHPVRLGTVAPIRRRGRVTAGPRT